MHTYVVIFLKQFVYLYSNYLLHLKEMLV